MARRDRRRVAVAVVAVLVAATIVGLLGRLPRGGEAPREVDGVDPSAPMAPNGEEPAAPPGDPLTWAPPDVSGGEVLRITEPGTYDLDPGQSYRIVAPERIDGAVHLRGGGDIVWIGGHIFIPDQGEGPVSPDHRRGLVITDGDAAEAGRTVHLEGLLIDGPDLAEGIDTHAPGTIVQLQNIHIADVHFRQADDRDGTDGWRANHPDVLQTWGSQAELRVDGLTASSAYQGIFLKEDRADRTLGPVWLRRVDLTAVEHEGTDGVVYTGHRMFTFYPDKTGEIRLDSGTIFVDHHPGSGWNREQPNPAAETAFWRQRFRDEARGRLVDEPSPGDAVFTDALGDPAPDLEGEDETGRWAGWSEGPLDWEGDEPGRIHAGSPPDGPFVPAESVGTDYESPGYLEP